MQVTSAQETAKESETKNLIALGNYLFEAQSALPMRGQTRQLTYGYDLRVSKDTLISYLPYFGRAYVAPVGTSEGGLDFTSTNFEYKVKEGKKGSWDVSIQTKDQKDNKKMVLKIQPSGYASLQVSSNDRQPMSYNGIITAVKKK